MKKKFSQCNPHLPPPREFFQLPIHVLDGKTHTHHDLFNSGIHLLGFKGCKLLFPCSHLINKVVKFFGVRLHLSKLRLGLVQLFLESNRTGKCSHCFFSEGMTTHRDSILGQVSYGCIVWLLNFPFIGFHLPHQHS